jgi:hypothetical protein
MLLHALGLSDAAIDEVTPDKTPNGTDLKA